MEKQVVLYATVPYKNDTSAIVQRIILFCPNREGVTAFIVPYRQKKRQKTNDLTCRISERSNARLLSYQSACYLSTHRDVCMCHKDRSDVCHLQEQRTPIHSRDQDWSSTTSLAAEDKRMSPRVSRYKHFIAHFRAVACTMSLARTINHIKNGGFAKYWRDMQYIGDAKWGRMVGIDRYVRRVCVFFFSDAPQQREHVLGKQ